MNKLDGFFFANVIVFLIQANKVSPVLKRTEPKHNFAKRMRSHMTVGATAVCILYFELHSCKIAKPPDSLEIASICPFSSNHCTIITNYN